MPERKTAKPPSAPPRQHTVQLPNTLSTKLETIAKAESNSVSAVMRRLLTQALTTKSSGDEAA